MIKTTKALSILPIATLVLGLLSQGCALKPKPSELEALEKLRLSPTAAAAQKRAPALVKSSDDLLKRSQEKWKDSELDDSIDAALMGQAKLKHAMALADQDVAKRRIAKAEDDLEDLSEEQQKVQKDLDAVNETIGLLHQTAQAREEQKAMEAQMEAEKKLATDKAETAEKISAAELALKTADTVQAATYAKAEYTAATDTLARAMTELQKSEFQSAQMSADIARKKAEQATAIAQPIYAEKAKGDENRARADALTREASAIAGVTVRRDARGMLQRIVLTIPAEQLFTKKQTVIAPGREAMLDPVAELMKKNDYMNYPVQIVAFADPRGSSSALLAMTLARAQSVQTALMSRGVESKRIMATGQGGAEPIASGKDRNRNNRIEVVFLYQ